MKAELEDGSIINLEKDCSCIHHDEPCWVYWDRLQYKLNKKLLADGFTMGFAVNEIARLNEKIRQMEQRRIVRLISE